MPRMDLTGITTVVFDFDGTLATCPYDFVRMRQEILRTMREHGLDPDAVGRLGLLETISAGAELLRAEPSRAATFRAEAMARLSAVELEAARKTRLLPGIIAALSGLRAAGLRLGIVTRNSVAAVTMILGDAPLPYDAMLCREHAPRPKPHTAHVLEMLRLLESEPARALMAGDHPSDIEMGNAAGMTTAAVLTGQSDEAALRAAGPHMLLPSVVELAALLLERRAGAGGHEENVHV